MSFVWALVVWLAGERIDLLTLGDYPNMAACHDAGVVWVASVGEWSPALTAGYACLPREVKR